MKTKLKIAVVGDIHDQWEEEDGLALIHLRVDLALFAGDFGNEAVDVVRRIASLPIPKAAILGNHDAWYSASSWGQKKSPYDRTKEDRVQQQLDLLGETHVGYSKLDFPQFNLSVVGSRPFSWGGPEWKNKEFLQQRYSVTNFEESIAKIVSAAKETAHNTAIFLGHNGPVGLGELPEDCCGRDWNPLGGDFGDPDFARAIDQVRRTGKNIPLVTFGHMHHRLRHTKAIMRTTVKKDEHQTIYLNSANVPRITEMDGQKIRNFYLVELENGTVKSISLVWLGNNFQLVSEKSIYLRAVFKAPMSCLSL